MSNDGVPTHEEMLAHLEAEEARRKEELGRRDPVRIEAVFRELIWLYSPVAKILKKAMGHDS